MGLLINIQCINYHRIHVTLLKQTLVLAHFHNEAPNVSKQLRHNPLLIALATKHVTLGICYKAGLGDLRQNAGGKYMYMQHTLTNVVETKIFHLDPYLCYA